jgi:ribosomal protein S18 acetylase RimI-like enzyme
MTRGDNLKEPDGQPQVEIVRLLDIGVNPSNIEHINSIFFQSTARVFSSDTERTAFRQLWLGQYLDQDPDKVHLAVEQAETGAPRVLGYLVGCWINPVTSPRFASLPFFSDFKPQCHAFPGQLHINLDVRARSRGIGRLLVEAFAAQSRAAGVRGIHVVTGKSARNVEFYRRVGFTAQGDTLWGSNAVVFLGRALP